MAEQVNGRPSVDIGDMDTQDLEKILDGKLQHPNAVLEEEQAQESEPEEQQAEATAEEGSEPEEAAQHQPDQQEIIEELRSRLEEESLRREQIELRMDHERLLREQANTRAGQYKEVAVDLARERRGRREEVDPDYPEPEEADARPVPLHPEVLRLRREVERLSEDATTRASSDALMDFVASRPELAEDTEDSQSILADMGPLVQRGRQEYSSLFETGNPRIVRETAKLILASALTEVRAGRLAEARRNREANRVEQFSAARQAKLNAGAVASSPAAAPSSRPKTTREMSFEELTARLDEMAPAPGPRQRR